MAKNRLLRRRATVSGIVGVMAVSALAACSSDAKVSPASGDESASGGSSTSSSLIVDNPNVKSFEFIKNSENTTIEPVLNVLVDGVCSVANEALPLEVSSIPQIDIDSQMQLMASQDALPPMFSAGGNPPEGAKLWNGGYILDLDAAMTDAGVRDMVSEGAVSTIKKLYGGEFSFLPYQYNIEGIFYNKALFEENGWDVPETWSDLLDVAAKAEAAGLTALSASGEQGWPLTRLLSGYIYRSLGPDAMQKIADGEAKLTDPEYVEAAQQIADLGAAGYFGKNVASLDYDASMNEFFAGNAAMIYMGSWMLTEINDPAKNLLGADSVGFFPFPVVEGGKGSIDQYPANVGLPATFAAATYTEDVAQWLTCISEGFGTEALKQGQITGFKATEEVELPAISEQIKDAVETSTDSVLWFEALFNAKASQLANTHAAPLVTGQESAEQYMKIVQDALDAG